MLEKKKLEYYEALLNRDKNYEGTFYVGVKTTGVFCHSTCPARKPKYKNCEFFKTSNEALLLGYRPCKKCNPLFNPMELPDKVKLIVSELEKDVNKKWTNEDFTRLGVTSSYARRQFQKYFNMTFIQYARSLRLSTGLKEIKKGSKIIDAQLESSFESYSGFRDAFRNVYGYTLSSAKEVNILYSQIISTKIGNIIAISSLKGILLLEFVDRRGLETEIVNLRKKYNAIITNENTEVLQNLKRELDSYFDGELTIFTVPIETMGTPMQERVWECLGMFGKGKVWFDMFI